MFLALELHAHRKSLAEVRKDSEDSLLIFPIDMLSFQDSIATALGAVLDLEASIATLMTEIKALLGGEEANLDSCWLQEVRDAQAAVAYRLAAVQSYGTACFEGMIQISREFANVFWEVCGDCYETEGRLPYEPEEYAAPPHAR
jgi:hypothetical protein